MNSKIKTLKQTPDSGKNLPFIDTLKGDGNLLHLLLASLETHKYSHNNE